MINKIKNQFRSYAGSVHSGETSQSAVDDKTLIRHQDKPRLPDCAYVLHAGIANVRRHRTV